MEVSLYLDLLPDVWADVDCPNIFEFQTNQKFSALAAYIIYCRSVLYRQSEQFPRSVTYSSPSVCDQVIHSTAAKTATADMAANDKSRRWLRFKLHLIFSTLFIHLSW